MLKQALPKLNKFTVVGVYSNDSSYEARIDHVKAVDAETAESLVMEARRDPERGNFIVLTIFSGHLKAV